MSLFQGHSHLLASHADVLRGWSPCVPAPRTGMPDECLRMSAWEAITGPHKNIVAIMSNILTDN